LGKWNGIIEKEYAQWLRFYDSQKNLILLPEECEGNETQLINPYLKIREETKILKENILTSLTDIGTFITTDPNSDGCRPVIAGTRTSVRRIAGLYNQGNNAEEIARRLNHLTITQIYAALTYYHANREEIDKDIADEQTAYEELAKQHYQQAKTSK
jgi:uncharacterized protein (DUF433 family)